MRYLMRPIVESQVSGLDLQIKLLKNITLGVPTDSPFLVCVLHRVLLVGILSV